MNYDELDERKAIYNQMRYLRINPKPYYHLTTPKLRAEWKDIARAENHGWVN